MSGDLRVTTAHLRELSAKQGQAAAELTTAVEAVTGVDTSVRWTHGPISWSTAAAVEAVQQARRAAASAMASVSTDLGQKLTTAASHYDRSDSTAAGALDATVQSR
ncbi:ESX-1 secretion-associated protein [Mycobacterium sp. 21AC1]|uniref:ESX-1 secretion-associated protein n=1 Tax=[Mycobacterium] appelbergii TaxID=2939269 RepID=UPI002938D1F5|nr:ESX-1 secretion-associated protein [Mycobacterium sp. 21AC1]MDV3123329.1 ESX-1 secretion-associated protein [Mycobacterium sp. 21AC1]